MTKKQSNEVESNLRKIGLPCAYIGITSLIVYYACNTIGACA